MNEYQPTKEELAVINERFAKEPYKSPEQLHLFPAMIIDNRMTAYFTRVHPTFLEQCVKDLINGVGFLVGHDKDKLPMARSFKGQMTSDGEAMEVFAKFFMQKNLVINGVNTDDFMRAFLGGTTEDVSIGFAAKRYECNICGQDIRGMDCSHLPGKKYNDKSEESETGTLCFAWIMEPAGPKGEALLEVSGVYKGAAPAAKQKKPSDIPKFIINLSEGKNLKEMPKEEAIAINFSFPFSDEYERGKGRGKGGPRQGDGGAKYCKCPKCGHTIDHERGKPCQEISCPKCGTKMEGTDKKGGEKVFEIDKFFAGKYSKEELAKIELSAENIDAILAQEIPERAGELKDRFKDQLNILLKEFPAYELLLDVRWSRIYINNLPDASFAVIEPGETDNKNARHLPYRNKKGELNVLRLKNALTLMGQIKPVTSSISLEELRNKANECLSKHRSEILETNNQVLLEQIGTIKTEILGYKQIIEKAGKDLQGLKNANAQLQQEVKDLKALSEEGKLYKADLIKEILELGVKLQGNKYEVETNKKMLEGSATNDIKKIRDQFLQELESRFPRTQTEKAPLHLPAGETPEVPEEAFKLKI